MAHYRLYVLDGADHIRGAFDLDCADDAEAVGIAEAHQDGVALELWSGARLVLRVEAGEPRRAP